MNRPTWFRIAEDKAAQRPWRILSGRAGGMVEATFATQAEAEQYVMDEQAKVASDVAVQA